MKSGCVKIGNSFNITGIGILVELQHYENGIPPNTKITDLNSKISWIVVIEYEKGQYIKKKREEKVESIGT